MMTICVAYAILRNNDFKLFSIWKAVGIVWIKIRLNPTDIYTRFKIMRLI